MNALIEQPTRDDVGMSTYHQQKSLTFVNILPHVVVFPPRVPLPLRLLHSLRCVLLLLNFLGRI